LTLAATWDYNQPAKQAEEVERLRALARFESFVENLMEGSFARLFGSKVHPVQIAKQIEREMEDNQTVGPDKVFVPNSFQIQLHPDDYEELSSAPALKRELVSYIRNAAEERGFQFLGPVEVFLEPDPTLRDHRLRVAGRIAGPGAVQSADQADEATGMDQTMALKVDDVREAVAIQSTAELAIWDGSEARVWPIGADLVTIGRALDNDLVIEHPSISRHHAELRLQAGRFYLVDLQSTNGLTVNGRRVVGTFLQDGDRLAFGSVPVQFRLTRQMER
jgi:hypothetical protein